MKIDGVECPVKGWNAVMGEWVEVPVMVPSGGEWRRNPDEGPAPAVVADVGPSVQGDWLDTYGASGYKIFGIGADAYDSLPSGIAVSPGLSVSPHTWRVTRPKADPDSSGDLETPNGLNRVIGCWYRSGTGVMLTMSFAVPWRGMVWAYYLDADHGRIQDVWVDDWSKIRLNNTTGAGSEHNFGYGYWIGWPVDKAAGEASVMSVESISGGNAVISGLFFDKASGGRPGTGGVRG